MEVATPLGAMALPMVLIGTTIGAGVRALGVVGVTVRVPVAPQLGSGRVMDMDLVRGRVRDLDMGMEVEVVGLMVVDMGPEVATVTLPTVAMVAGMAIRVAADMAIRVAASILRRPLRRTRAGMGRENPCGWIML